MRNLVFLIILLLAVSTFISAYTSGPDIELPEAQIEENQTELVQ